MSTFFELPKTAPPCPHCGQECLSFLAKSTLGPAFRKRCMSCQKYVSVAVEPSMQVSLIGTLFCLMFGAVLALVLGFAHAPGGPLVTLVVGALAATPLLCFVYYRKVPLVSREA